MQNALLYPVHVFLSVAPAFLVKAYDDISLIYSAESPTKFESYCIGVGMYQLLRSDLFQPFHIYICEEFGRNGKRKVCM